MRLYGGIEAGGTKVVCAVARDAATVAGTGAGGLALAGGPATLECEWGASEVIRAALRQAARGQGAEPGFAIQPIYARAPDARKSAGSSLLPADD